MMNAYLYSNRTSWRSRLARYSKLLLRRGWFVALTIILVTVCSIFIPDSPSADSYQATLQVQVQLPGILNDQGHINATATFFSKYFVDPSTLSLALSKLNVLQQFHTLQTSDLQSLVSATPVTNTNVVALNALGDTPQDATTIVTDVYQASLQKVHTERSFVVNGLNTALSSELQQVEADLAKSLSVLQTLSAAGEAGSFQYRLLSSLQREQQKRIDTINALLVTLGQEDFQHNDILSLGKSSADITTVPGTQPKQSQRIALSPLVGLIMGLGGVLLASHFSNSLPLRGKKREAILPHIAAIIPVLPKLRSDRLQVLKDTSSESLPLLRYLRHQASEYEKRLQLITIISPKGQEGKSTVATSLAIASAQSGLHTLLVDANPRRPVLHEWFKLHNTIGMLDAVRSLATGILGPSPIRSTSIEKLSLLPIGNVNKKDLSNTIEEALRIDGLQPLLEIIHNQTDLIIFDGPSLFSDAGAINLLTLSDAVLLIVDARRSQSTKVIEAEALLSEMGVSFAAILNQASRESVE
jgi:Mrp family chromosome partitioning ATPase/capsular polysaccharide biosynthesis protein